MTRKTHWCDCCMTAVIWVGVLQDKKGRYLALCRECFDLLLKEKEVWRARGFYSKLITS